MKGFTKMKKLIFIVCILITSNIIFASNSNKNYLITLKADTLEIKAINYSKSSTDSIVTINIEYPQINGIENDTFETKINSFLEEEFKQSIPWYEEILSDSAEYQDNPYEMGYSFETGFQVQFNSQKFISIVLNHYQFTGGAHGNYFALGYNITTDDGKILTLKDIIKEDSFDLLTYECEQAILETYEANSLIEAGTFENELVIPEDQDFYITPTALVIQFDPYEIGPYAMGEIVAEIPFEKIIDILQANLPFPTY
jgi:hypothetical protein